MKTQKILLVLTVANLGLLIGQLYRTGTAEAQSVPEVLRARRLEIVDDEGRVRASIRVHPEDRTKRMPNGKPYPDTVMLRLIDPEGRPAVKIEASKLGGGVGLVGETDVTHVLLQADGTSTSLKLKNNDGRQQLIQP